MKLINAAIKYPNGEVVTARRHYKIIELQAAVGINSIDAEQGFVDEAGNFYDRAEAKKIALEAEQIPKDHEGVLYSEDLWGEENIIEL